MKTKKVFCTELAYVFGVLILALGTTLMERADFGMSMVTAPAYVIHLRVSRDLPRYTFGTSTYVFQAFLLILLSLIVRKFKKGYLFSFVTAVIFGVILDLFISLFAGLPGTLPFRTVYYVLGMVFCSVGVSLLFHTYITPEAYELFVKEIAETFRLDSAKVKTVYDISSCLLSVILSFAFFGFGHFEGVKLGTFFCALINGQMIGICSRFWESRFEFTDGLPLRKYFE